MSRGVVTVPVTETNLLHDVQLAVLRLKQLDEQLEDLRVQQLVTGADLWGGRADVQRSNAIADKRERLGIGSAASYLVQ